MIDTMLPSLDQDPRLQQAIDLFNAGEYEEASDLMEDLFFEAVGGERPLARVLLQLCVGMVHVDQGQRTPAIERIDVGIDEASRVSDWLGIDGARLTADMRGIVKQITSTQEVSRVRIERSPD